MSERWVDVSHEALIRGWPRLRGWIEEDRAGLRMHRRLTDAAQEWHKSRDESALYRGARLSQAVEWREHNAPALNELERTFLDASVTLEQHEADVRDKRRRRVIVWLSASLVVFAVLAGLAGLKWRQAYRQGQIALARQLGAQADLMRDQPEMLFRRLLLATEALKRLHAVEAESLEVDLTLRRGLASLPRHIARVHVEDSSLDVQLSPDGRNLLTVSHDKDARVWEIATGKELVRFEGGPIKGLSGDGKYVVTEEEEASGGSKDVAQVWETDTGGKLLRLQLPGTRHYALSADGRYLAVSTQIYDRATSTYSEAITRLWDVPERREIPGSAPGSVRAFSQDATVVATSRGLWDVTPELKQVFSWELDTFDVVLTSDGGHVAIWTERAGQKQIEVWSRATKKMTASLPTPGSDGYLQAVTSDGRFVILRDSDRDEVQVHDIAAKVIVSRAALHVRAAVVLPSGQHLIASLHDAVDVWALGREGGDVLAIDHEDKVVAVGLTPLGGLTTIAQNGEKLLIRAWDVKTRREMPERVAQVTGTAAVFAPDGQSFAVMGDGGLEVRRVDDSEPVAKFAYASPAAVIWSPDGRYLAARKERDVRVWDLRSRQSISQSWQLTLPGLPTAFALTRGGDSLAAVVSGEASRLAEPNYAKLWKVATSEELKSSEPNKGQSIRFDTHCALSPDAQYLVMRDLKVLEMKTGTLLPKKLGLGANETTCVISTDGRYLATSSQGIMRLWELKSGREAFHIPTNDRPLVFDQNARYLATLSDGNTVRVWFLRQDDLIEEACRRLPRNLSKPEWDEYVRDGARRKTCPKLP